MEILFRTPRILPRVRDVPITELGESVHGLFLFKVENCQIKLLLLQSDNKSSIPNHLSIPKTQFRDSDLNGVRTAIRGMNEATGLTKDDYETCLRLRIDELSYNYGIIRDEKVVQRYVTGYFAEIHKEHREIELSNRYTKFSWLTRKELVDLFAEKSENLPPFLYPTYMSAFDDFGKYYFEKLSHKFERCARDIFNHAIIHGTPQAPETQVEQTLHEFVNLCINGNDSSN